MLSGLDARTGESEPAGATVSERFESRSTVFEHAISVEAPVQPIGLATSVKLTDAFFGNP